MKIIDNILRIFFLFFLGVVSQIANAKEDIILTVTNSSGKSVNLDITALESFESTTLKTHTPWTEGLQVFTGVRVSVLLTALGMQGVTLRALTLNDYEVEISVKDAEDYPVIIAYKRNGRHMLIRDKGPLWIIYPLDEFPELRNLQSEQKMAWHLSGVVVE